MVIKNTYNPDYKVPVAWLIEESMELHGIDIDELSDISKITKHELSDIIESKIKLTEQSAIGLQVAFGTDREVWLAVDEAYWS
jgi:plasmid maintenance system antidote protein VapI